MSILRRIQQMRASLSGGSFLLEASGDLAAGDTLLIVKTSGAHQELPEEVTVTERGDGSFKLADEIMALFSEGEEVIFGYFTDLKDPQSLQWDISDLDGGTGRNQMGQYFRDRMTSKRTLTCSWGALSGDDMAGLLCMMEDVFFLLEYPDALTGERKRSEFYVGNRTTPMLRQKPDGSWMWQNLSATFTER